MTHILWDWNGTLLDDTDAAIAALNVQLRTRSLPTITRAWYREHFAFPVRPFYAACGIDLAKEDWDRLAQDYHDAYARQPKRLNVEAREALETARAAGVRQCIISALRQDLLKRDVARYGLADYFDCVYGVDNLDGASKLGRARELMAEIGFPQGSNEIVLIGDALHDKEVADALGVRCVLAATGGHSAARLRAVAPTGETLMAALRLVSRANDLGGDVYELRGAK